MDRPPPQARSGPVAVVGIGCAFPGAVGAGAFWSRLLQGACAVAPVPRERWDASLLPPSAARFAGFIDDADCFDAGFFGISPREAAALDPRQRLALQVAWWALEDAAIAPDSLRGAALGVFVGATNGEYAGAFAGPETLEPHLGIGLSNAVIANRISHVLGAHGPSMAIDTACSASLVAVHQACRSLQAGDCTVALAGGVGLMLSPVNVVALGRAGMLAPDGRCKSFDAAADGYGRGEGCGLVVLKRLADALADGDRIHALIRGSATNHDGLSNGITAPNGLSQEALIRAALADADAAPGAIGYVEAHGTGTLLGDPTEARALGHAIGQQPGRTAPLLIGSVKTNIGHLEAAAGVAGLIKLVLCVRHGRIAPSLHYTQGNPHIDFEGLGLAVAATATAWPDGPGPRLGAVSSFGFGGANAHVVVEQAPAAIAAEVPPSDRPDVLLLSAATDSALREMAGACSAALQEPGAARWHALAALSQTGRAHLRHRLAVVARSTAEGRDKLAAFAAGGSHADAVAAIAGRRAPKIALLCPGQGAQRPGMARELLAANEPFRAAIAEADEALGWSLGAILRDSSADIDRTSITQPALLATGVGLARALAAHGVQPAALAGHSLGEYTAAVIAGGVGYADALRLVAARGRLMEGVGGDGAMAAVLAGEQEVLPYLGERLSIAAVNGPQAVTISGDRQALQQACTALEAAGLRVRPLRVATAFHSALLDPMLEEFRELAARVRWQPLRVPVVSNLSGGLLPAGHVYDAAYWVRHTRAPVRFGEGLRALEGLGVDTALELGALPVLSALAQGGAAKFRTATALEAGSGDGIALLRTLGGLHAAGARIGWGSSRLAAAAGDSLPRYPFAKDRYPLHVGARAFGDGQPAGAAGSAAPAPVSALEQPAAPDAASVRQRVVAIVARLLSVAPERVDTAAPFLELGADSLILIQAVGRIEAQFGVRIAVRSFFEELSTIDAVCAWLMRAQAVPAAQAATPAAAAPAVAVTPPRPAAPVPAPAGLNDTQRAHLAQLAADYTKRTTSSRAYAQRFRPVLADSRGSAGFRFSIKEMLYPIVGQRGAGSRVWDVDGNEYIDISMGFGVQLFGHEPPFLREAMAQSLARGIRIGPQSDAAGEVAELICELTGVERVAFCNSGTEAVMTALRLARTATGRHRVAVFRGSYHGHFDGVLGETQGDPWTVSPRVAGIAPGMVAELALFEYGSAESLEQLRPRMSEFAAVLVEPVQSRNPALQPAAFLHALRALTRAAGTVLVFDEVLTGFRIGAGGAQAHFGVHADLVTYGKVVGGGLPIGVVAGRRELLAGIDGGLWQYGDGSFPAAQTTFFAGTFNKHPLAMASARAVLHEIRRNGAPAYDALNGRTARMAQRLDRVFEDAGAPIRTSRFGSLFRFVFHDNLDPFFYHLLHRGLYVWEGRNLFLSTAHTEDDVARIVERVADSVAALRAGGFLAAAAATARAVPAPPVELPLSLAQRQLATLAALSREGSAAYTIAVAIDLEGAVEPGRLQRAFEALVQRHDALRAAIDLEAGVQRIAAQAAFTLHRQRAGDGDTPDALLDALLAAELAQPIGLDAPPALRATLVERTPDRHVLLVAAHHALVDGQSLQVLLEELAALYGGETLAAAPAYRVLAERMARAGSAPQDEAHRAFWQRTLAGAPAGIELPFARMRPPLRRFAGARVAAELPPAPLRRLEQAAAARGLSSSMALLAAFAATLRRCGAPADMVLGVPFAGRDPAFERAVGYCAHLLPVRLDLPALASTGEVMQQVRQRFLDAMEHAAYPMARTIADLGIARDPARPPLVNVSFNVDRVPVLPPLAGVRLAPRALPLVHSRFEIGCNLLDWQDGARIEIDYDSDLFAHADMEALAAALVAMIGRFGGDPQQPFDERGDARQRWLLPAAANQGPHLLQRFTEAAWEAPAAGAVEVDGQPVLDRQALDRWSDRVAEAVTAAARGAGPVALLLGRNAAMPAAMLGCWKAGRAYLPLDPQLPPARLALLLELAAPCCLLAGQAPPEATVPVLPLPAMPAPGPSAQRSFPAPDADATAYLLFTSGSTGTPKLVAVPHRAVRHYLDGIVAGLGLQRGLRYAVVTTFAADLGLTAVLPALFHGGCLCIAGASLARDAEAFAATMRRSPVDLLKIVPSHLEGLLAAADPAAVLPRTHLVLGGEAARPALLAALARTAHACRVFNHFGPTEATVGVLLGEWDGGAGPVRFQQPIGAARIALLDAQGRPCAIGEAGEVAIAGPSLAAGYVGTNAAGEEAFAMLDLGQGPERAYRSGDLAVLREDGSIELLGRRDDQIKIRGHRIEPAEIVAAITREPAIRTAAVVQRPTGNGRPALVAYVVPADGAIDTQGLLRRLRDELPEPMVPAAVVVLAAFPVTANGKLDVAALPAPAQEPPPGAAPDGSAQQALLLRLWRELLGHADIGAQSDFFQQGGDSIQAIQLIAKLHQAGWRAKTSDLYAAPTLQAFAARIRPAGGGEIAPAQGPCPLLPSQLRLHARLGEWPAHFNLSVSIEPAPWVTPELLAQALLALVQQHDALRLRFGMQDGQPAAWFGAPVAPRVLPIPADAGRAAALSRMQASLAPAQGALLAAGWAAAQGGKPAAVVLAVHHLVCDGISLRILLDDLRQALLELHEGRAPRLAPRTASVQQWAQLLPRLAHRDGTAAELPYWQLAGSMPPPSLPQRSGAGAQGADLVAQECSETISLGEALTSRLLQPAPGTAATAQDHVIAAVTLALGDWTGERLACVELEGHGRETSLAGSAAADVDLGRTVGWFSSRFPAWFDLEGVPLAHAAAMVAEQRRAIPAAGFGHGLLRHLGPDAARAALAALPPPEISLNYLGQVQLPPDDAFRVASWLPDGAERGAERAGALPRLHRIAIEAAVADGRLVAVWQFNPAIHARADIAALAQSFARHAAALAGAVEIPAGEASRNEPLELKT
ncbi:aminotransferase class III-fold pyridoxal phosphate-dependent enzyme [Caenimonas terrae]|uniref:Aminotransferase class III-fold pyridoxal phosphate-dependent enzyme n=1 Tax=Caenimonas terrae TaxID=696074 RepID=A0ABW0NGN6_9BURK